MKVAIIGSNSYDSLEYNLNEAFVYNGYNCKIFDIHINSLKFYKNKYFQQIDILARRFYNKYDHFVFTKLAHCVLIYEPELVICVYRFIPPFFVDILKEKSKVIHINPDALTTFEQQQVFASNYDVWFTKDPYIYLFMTKKMKLNVKLYNEAFNLRLHKKPDIDKLKMEEEVNIDVMSYGTMYPYRCRMLKYLLDNNIKLSVFGIKPNRFYDKSLDSAFKNKYIMGEEKSRLLYGSRIVFNQMHYAEIDSVNNRFFETNGSGAFQLSDYRPILHDLLPIDPEMVSFKSIDEGIEKIKYYLVNPELRIEISSRIYLHFVKKYNYDILINYILNNIG